MSDTRAHPTAAELRARYGLPPRNRDNPSLRDSIAFDPTLTVPIDSREVQLRNFMNPNRLRLKPGLARVSKVLITIILMVKRLPILRKWGSEEALNRLTPLFTTRFCSTDTVEQLLRHFNIENQLEVFIARNCGSSKVAEPRLAPTHPIDLTDNEGMNAVVRHDVNVFNLIIDMGEADDLDLSTKPLSELDFSMLELPLFDTQPEIRRWMKLDLESALSIIVVSLALFMDYATAERALNSFQLDESMFVAIAELTGDDQFRHWTPVKFGNWAASNGDVARDLYWHFLINEYAHTRLCQLRDSAAAAAS